MGSTCSLYRSEATTQKVLLFGWYFHDRVQHEQLKIKMKLTDLADDSKDWNVAVVRSGKEVVGADIVCMGPVSLWCQGNVFEESMLNSLEFQRELTSAWTKFELPWFSRDEKQQWTRVPSPQWANDIPIFRNVLDKKEWAKALYTSYKIVIPGIYDENTRAEEQSAIIRTMKRRCRYCQKNTWKHVLGAETTKTFSRCTSCFEECCGLHLWTHESDSDSSTSYRCPKCHDEKHRAGG